MRVIITPWDIPPPIPAAIVGGIVAQPGGQANATQITGRVNIVTSCASGGAVILGMLQPPRQQVFADAGAPVPVYPTLGTQIKGYAVNVPVTIADGDEVTFTFDGVTTWLIS